MKLEPSSSDPLSLPDQNDQDCILEGRASSRSLAALNAVAAAASMTPDVDDVLRRALALTLDVVGAEAGAISILNESGDELEFRVQQGWRVHDFVAESVRVPADQGLSGIVVSTGEPVVTADVRREHRVVVAEFYEEEAKAMALAPMRANGGVLGVLGVMNYTPREFSPDEVTIISAIADQIGIAFDNARLYGETRQRLDELTVLHEVALAAASTLSPDEIADRASAAVRKGLACDRLCLRLMDQEEGRLTCAGAAARQEGRRALLIEEGLVGWVASHGQPVRVGDVLEDPRYVDRGVDLRSVLIVPLVVGDRVIGVLDASSARCDAFTRRDEQLLTTVARQLAVAVENARLHQETERRLAEVSALYQLATRLNSTLDVQEALESIVSSLQGAIGCRRCFVALFDPVNNVLEICAEAGIGDDRRKGFKSRLGEGAIGRVASEGKPLFVPNVLQAEDVTYFDPVVRSFLIVPLSVQDNVIGVLAVDSEEIGAFAAADERLLIIAASQAAIAIENVRLYTRLEHRARNLAEAYAELQEADRVKDEMVQNVSHELRTPLTFVKGYVELLLSQEAGPLSETQSEYLKIVAQKTDAVTRLVNDIIFLQQADRVSTRKQSLSLGRIAGQALRGCAATAEEAGLLLERDFPADLSPVNGDEGRLLQVFDNLLNNAIKFTPRGGRISIKIRDAGAVLEACVCDEGIGIPKDQQDKIFERFYQIDGSTRRRFGGVGLGLAIVKRIIEAHNGRVWVESQPGCGSSFCFTIPKHHG